MFTHTHTEPNVLPRGTAPFTSTINLYSHNTSMVSINTIIHFDSKKRTISSSLNIFGVKGLRINVCHEMVTEHADIWKSKQNIT